MDLESDIDKYLSEDTRRKIAEDAYKRVLESELERRYSSSCLYEAIDKIAEDVVSKKLRDVLSDETVIQCVKDRVYSVAKSLSEFTVFGTCNGEQILSESVEKNRDLVEKRVQQILKEETGFFYIKEQIKSKVEKIVDGIIQKLPFVKDDQETF